MKANEYKIKYESIEEFRRMAYKNIACWEDQLSEIEGGLNRLLNMKSFQGETADAVRLYLQEVHKTLLSGIRQCLQEYKVRLLLYQKEYYKIDADKGACLSEKEICQIGNHLEKQEKYLYEKNEEIKKILIDIWDILLLPVPSQETLLSDITETIKTTRTLDTDIQCYETTIEKEVTQEYGSMVESTRAAVEKYIGRTRDISNYTPGETGKVKEMAALKEKITKSKLYLKEKQTEINIASEQLKDRAIRERLGWYQQQLEALKTVDVSQLVDNIAEYFGKSLEQVVMGNFTTDVTLLGTVSQVLLGLSGLDLPCDLRDIIADVKHCSEGEKGAAAMLVLDLVAVVPGIGAIKYADEAGTVVKGIGKNIGDIAGEVKNGEKLLKSTGEAKAVQEELEQAGKALKKVGKEGAAGKAAGKSGSKTICYTDYDNIYQSSIHNAGKDKIMLGKYDGGGPTSYITKAGDEYTYFSLGNEWNTIKAKYGYTDDDMFKLFNEAFLDEGINAGKIFQFSHNPINDTGALGQEYQYLLKNNYKWDAGTMTMKPRY